MSSLTPPRLFKQPKGSAKCWAYALASWLQATPGRPNVAPEDLVRAAVHADKLNGGGISSAGLIRVMESTAVNMQWKIVDGATLDIKAWNRMTDDFGYLFAVVHEKANSGPFALSHARVVYDAIDNDAVAGGAQPLVSAVDPILEDMLWTLQAMKDQKIMLGVIADASFVGWYPGRDDGWHKAKD